MPYTSIVTEGGLLPADILDAISAGELEGQRPEDFGLERTRNLSDRISAAWQVARSQWALFQSYLADLAPGETATTETREQWMLPLLRVLGYQLNRNRSAYVVQGRTYAISHRAGEGDDAPPIHIESVRTSLDARPPSGRPRLSPHALVQEYLNSTEQLWGIVTNGERLRVLRDSSRFTRPAYVEFDLRAILEGEKFSEFALLYRLLHRTRLPVNPDEAASCLLEKYHQRAVEAGGRVREGLRDGVESALKLLGDGLLRHPANADLRALLARGLEAGSDGDGSLTPLGYYRQLLRLVYRLLFLMVAEERGLIAAEEDEDDMLSPSSARPTADRRLAIYREHYSVSRLRHLAETSGAGRGPYTDLWEGLLTTFRLLEGSDEAAPRRLGLSPLDGDLFGDSACAALTTNTRLTNAELLAAVRALSLYREKESRTLRRVNYGALDVEELGSVYESLLDYRPMVRPTAVPAFDLVTGTERKTTGSYYTRPELVQELIKSALIPVLEERLKTAGPDPKAREEAILALRVADPACGSGAFLLAAARRLGRELARVRAGEEQSSPTQFRRAVRDVIRRCIFGVDLNPLAVDLCKLSLWLEGHAAGLPLSFLDHHIRHGNSLIGATRELVEAGIPDDAYKPVTGDDKATASSIRKRNKQERDLYLKQGMVQHDLFGAAKPAGDDLAAALRALDEAADDSVAAVRARAARYAALRRETSPERAKFDLWTAAFFQFLTPANANNVPTSKDLIDFNPNGEKALVAAPLAEDVGFFHWELEYPQVFSEAGGFDVVLGNPPWERIKLQEQEHFVDVPEISGATNKAAREKAIATWRNGDERQRARITLFDAAKYRAEAESRFVRASGRFPLTAVGDVNTYALFSEHSRNLLAPTGRAGIIVPTGIATDETCKQFFGDMVSHKALESYYGFKNEKFLFARPVEHTVTFGLMTMLGDMVSSDVIDTCWIVYTVEEMNNQARRVKMKPEDIALFNPNTLTCPTFRTNADAALARSIYQRCPILLNEKTGINTWDVNFLRMFDLTNDSQLFSENPRPNDVPLYEGNMVSLFDHRYATFDRSRREYVSNTLRNPDDSVQTQSFVSNEESKKRALNRGWRRKWYFGIRRIARNTDIRTTIGSYVPEYGVTYGLYLVMCDRPVLEYIGLTTTLNSFAFDYLCRTKLSQPSLTYGLLYQLPVLPPDRFKTTDVAYIVPRVAELVYTAWDIKAFAEDIWAEGDEVLRAELLRRNRECNAGVPAELFSPRDGFPLPPYRWDEERRAIARAELDARIARLYGLTRDELRYILDPADVYGPDFPGETFRVLKEKETKQFGEYRTRRLVLEAWDREEQGR